MGQSRCGSGDKSGVRWRKRSNLRCNASKSDEGDRYLKFQIQDPLTPTLSPSGRGSSERVTRIVGRDAHPTLARYRNLIVSRVSFLRVVSDSGRWTRPRVRIAETATAAGHVRHTFRDCPILAVPINTPTDESYDCTPGGITERAARRSSEHRRRRKGSDNNRQFSKSSRHDASPRSAAIGFQSVAGWQNRSRHWFYRTIDGTNRGV